MKYKGTLIGLFLFAGLFFVYTNFIQGTENDPLLTSQQVAGVNGSIAGQEIIEILEELNKIKLDTSLFDDESFNTLIDRKESINPENVGRTNPFEPIGFGINTSGNIVGPNDETVQVINIQSAPEETSVDEE